MTWRTEPGSRETLAGNVGPWLALFRFRIWGAAILLALASFALYAPSLRFGFINFDDPTVLLAYPERYDETSFPNSLRHIFVEDFPREEPLFLRDVSWALDSRIFGFRNPLGYHLGNLILNALNAALAFLLLWTNHRRFGLALAGAALYAALPVRVEGISWVMGRKDVLVTAFILAALLAQTAELRTPSPWKRRCLWSLSLLFTVAALFSKINALTLFAVLGVHRVFAPVLRPMAERTPSPVPGSGNTGTDIEARAGSRYGWRHRIRSAAVALGPHAVISVAVYVWYGGVLARWGVMDRGVDTLSPFHLKNLLLFTPLVLGRYLQLVFWPGNFRIFHDWPSIHQPLTDGEMVLSVILAMAMAGAMVWSWRNRRDVFFYLVVFLLLMVPYLNLTYIGIWVANRYVYLSALCLVMVVLLVMEEFVTQANLMGPSATVGVIAVAVLVNGALAWRDQWRFEDSESLWRYETSLPDPTLMAFANMATVHLEHARTESGPGERKKELERAISLTMAGFRRFRESGMRDTAPHLGQLYYVRGLLDRETGQPLHVQRESLEKAHELNPRDAVISRQLAEVLYRVAVACPDEEERRRLASRSLDLFRQWLASPAGDPADPRVRAILEEGYAATFPFLRERVAGIPGK